MKILNLLKGAIFFKFLSKLYHNHRAAFYVVCVIIGGHFCANMIKSNIYPFFIYSMYSAPEYEVPDTTSKLLFLCDKKELNIPNLFVAGRLEAPISRYMTLIKNDNEDPNVNKRMNYLYHFLPASVVHKIKDALYAKSFDVPKFKKWYVNYIRQYLPVTGTELSVYQVDYLVSDLSHPIKTTHIISFYEK